MGLHKGNHPLLRKILSYLLPNTRHRSATSKPVRESRSFARPICILRVGMYVRVTFHVCQAGRKQTRFCNSRWKVAGSPAAPRSCQLALWCHSLEGSVPWSSTSAEASAAPPSLRSPGPVAPGTLAATVSHLHKLWRNRWTTQSRSTTYQHLCVQSSTSNFRCFECSAKNEMMI